MSARAAAQLSPVEQLAQDLTARLVAYHGGVKLRLAYHAAELEKQREDDPRRNDVLREIRTLRGIAIGVQFTAQHVHGILERYCTPPMPGSRPWTPTELAALLELTIEDLPVPDGAQ